MIGRLAAGPDLLRAGPPRGIMASTATQTITPIDGHYMHPGRAAAYLLRDGEDAAFVDNVTRFSVPRLLRELDAQGLAPEQVRYIIVTHVHLDHSGGTAELAKHCPNARVVCHPKAERHLVDPSRLVAGATAIYGEEAFAELYGEIEAIASERVMSMADGATLELGHRTLCFLDAPGHARHHFVVHDAALNTVLSGDAFGSFYPQLQHGTAPYISYVCAPPQFEPGPAQETVRRIVDTGAERVGVTHFGPCDSVRQCGEQLIEILGQFDEAVHEAAGSDRDGESLTEFCREKTLAITEAALRRSGLDPQSAEVMEWAMADQELSAMGLQTLVERRRGA